MKDFLPVADKASSAQIYMDFLTSTLGVSREEVLQVVKHSGISTRRIAEYLIKQQSKSAASVSSEE